MEEVLNNNTEQQSSKVLIALTKTRGKNKILVASMDGYGSGYQVDGIYVEQNGVARIFSISESQVGYGIPSQDLKPGDAHYEEITQAMDGYDGEESTQCIIDVYGLHAGTACVEAKTYGWLPAAGEMALVRDNLEAFNAACEAAGGQPIGSGKYWLSQRRNANYPWFYDAAAQGVGSWLGGNSSLLVRPCMAADEYAEA